MPSSYFRSESSWSESVQVTDWIRVIDAITRAGITAVLGGFAAYIAWRQWHTARNRLKLDLFDRRLKIYQAVQTLIWEVMFVESSQPGVLRRFRTDLVGIEWLFSREIADFVDSEIQGIAVEIIRLERRISHTSDSDRIREYDKAVETLRDSLSGSEMEFEQLVHEHMSIRP